MKADLKFLIISAVVFTFALAGVLTFVSVASPTKVAAQNEVEGEIEIVVSTTHYSVLSTNVFVFGGAYSGNMEEKGLTTYFEYKRNDADLDEGEGRQETIPVVRGEGANESGEFYTSPSLQLASDYYFRAVGYLNENSDEKFYGSIISFRTGAPFITSIPYTAIFDELGNYESFPYTPPICDPNNEVLINGGCVRQTSTPPTCVLPQVLDLGTNTCVTPTTPPTEPPTQPSTSPTTPTTPPTTTDFEGGLVPCGTQKGEDGLISNPCNFNYFMQMLNEVIEFIFKYLVIPIAAIMFAYAGFLMVTSGGSSESKTKAKSIFTNTVIGLVIAAGAFLIVKTLLAILGYTEIDRFFN